MLSLISEALLITIDFELVSCNFAKTGFNVIKKNADVVRVTTSVLHFFIENLAQSIRIKTSKIGNPMAKQLIVNYIKIIIELQKSFRTELRGNPHITQLTSIESLKADTELKKIIAGMSTTALTTAVVPRETSFDKNIFNGNDVSLEKCVNLIRQVLSQPSSVNAAMSSDAKSNLCCQTLMALSKEYLIIETNPEAYNQVLDLVYDLIASKYLDNKAFKYIEAFLMTAILSKNYWLGVGCLVVFIRYLQNLKDPELINHYFILLQKLQSFTTPSLKQQRISFIFSLFCKTHKCKIQEALKSNLNFTKTFDLIKAEPCEQNYIKLIESLKNVNDMDNKEMKSFCDLIEMLEECDWCDYNLLILQVLDTIKNFVKIEKKMILILKMQRSFDKKLPFKVKVKILEIHSSCLPHLTRYKGLANLVENSLEKILNENYMLRRSWFNLTKEACPEKYKIDENVTVPENIIKTLSTSTTTTEGAKLTRKRPLGEESSQEQNLKKILIYSKWLSKQKTTKEDRQIISEIKDALDKIGY